MELPFICSGCGQESMIDLDKLERRPLDRITWMDGFQCTCGVWKPVWFETALLSDAMRKLDDSKKDFRFHFAKVLKRALTTYERGMEIYGSQQFQNMATNRPLG